MLLARGDMLLDEFEPRARSPIPNVSDEAWGAFASKCATGKLSAVSKSNALGAFEMMPRRLHDLGFVRNLSRSKVGGRTVWLAEFVRPLTCERFLRSLSEQRRAFAASMADYASRISSGEISVPGGESLSGALAILHRCGPRGLDTWAGGERFPSTSELHERCAGLF